MKKMLSIFLAIVILLNVIMVTILNVSSVDSSSQGIYNRLLQIRDVYPAGSYFTKSGNLCASSTASDCRLSNIPARGGLSTGAEAARVCWDGNSCCGFARYVFYNIFYHAPEGDSYSTKVSLDNAKPGDFVVFRWVNSSGTTSEHYGIFLSYDSNYVYVYDSNYTTTPTNKVGWETKVVRSRLSHIWHSNSYSTYNSQYGGVHTHSYVNLGEDFYATIMNYDSWKPITLDYTDDSYVRLREETGSANQVWRFQRQEDGSYVITSAQSGKALELHSGNNVENNPVSAPSDYWGGAYQRWYIEDSGGDGYLIKSAHYTSEGWYLSLDKNYSTDDGTAITTCKLSEDSGKVWAIYNKSDVQLKAPVLTVKPGSSSEETVFLWDSAYGSTGYDVKIWKDEVNHDIPSYHTEWNASSGFSIQLPPGNYEAYVCSKNFYQIFGSENVKFTVEGKTPVNLGDDFYAVILNYDYWKPITLDYDDDNCVRLREETNSANQVWRFQRQEDGSYVICSAQTGKVLELSSGNNVENNPVSAPSDYWGGAYQRWYIYENSSGGYLIESYHYSSEGWYLTLDENSSTNGTAITTCKATGNPAQVWAIYNKSDVQLKAPVLTVKPGSSSEKTVFSWDSVYGSTGYDVKIWKDEVNHDVSSYHTEWNTSSGYSLQLPPGNYEAYVCSRNFYQFFGSQNVKFTVTADTYQISYDANGGRDVPVSQTKTYGENIILSLIEPKRNGYTFAGWNTQKDGTGTSYDAGEIYTANSSVTLYAQWEKSDVGVKIKLVIESYNNTTEKVTVNLVKRDETNISYSAEVTGNGSEYYFEKIEAGEYILTVSKAEHVTREYEVMVGDSDANLNVKIHLIGDITGDGKVNTVDVARANSHAKSVSVLSGYDFSCADVTGDGKVNTVDVARMNSHAKGVVKLW